MKNNFDFLNLNSNDKLSKMKYDDTIELIKKLKDFKLSLRDNLNLNNNITFGLEIEFENLNCNFEKLTNKFKTIDLLPSTYLTKENIELLKSYKKKNKFWEIEKTSNEYLEINPEEVFYWDVKHDYSLNDGAEITSPILIDKKEYWKDLKKVCDFIKNYGEISTHSAGHIHVGSHALGISSTSLLNFIKLWSVYENVIYRFGYNEYLTKNSGINYCRHVSEKFSKLYDIFKNKCEINSFIDFLSEERAQAVNFQNIDLESNKVTPFGTIEFRNPNGTLDPVIWQNNVNFFTKMLLYCKSNKFDLDKINKRKKKMYDFENYNHIFTEQAIELSDMLFNNNLDKVYFLRQYIKDFDTSDISMKKTKKFTR